MRVRVLVVLASDTAAAPLVPGTVIDLPDDESLRLRLAAGAVEVVAPECAALAGGERAVLPAGVRRG